MAANPHAPDVAAAQDPNSAHSGTAGTNIKFDLENGDMNKEKKIDPESEELDEYAGLVRYINTYRDGRRKSIASMGGVSQEEDMTQQKKRPWWAFWRSNKQDDGQDFICPEDWLMTDMHKGLQSTEIDGRRKRVGFNELTTEKENMFLKFLSYFQGPILYGECQLLPPDAPSRRARGPLSRKRHEANPSQSWSLPFSWPLVCVNGSISPSLSVFCCSMPPWDGTRRSKLPMSLPA
jgi:Cation transporter/ATPase, N-terminus